MPGNAQPLLSAQVLGSLAALHDANITHRDVKASNVVWGLRRGDDGGDAPEAPPQPHPHGAHKPTTSLASVVSTSGRTGTRITGSGSASGGGTSAGSGGEQPESLLRVLLIDLSSAYSDEALALGLFGPRGPSAAEETPEASPPERVFAVLEEGDDGGDNDGGVSNGSDNGNNDHADHDGNHGNNEGKGDTAAAYVPSPAFDSWSVGALLLELLLGTPSVFTVDQRTRALLLWQVCG